MYRTAIVSLTIVVGACAPVGGSDLEGDKGLRCQLVNCLDSGGGSACFHEEPEGESVLDCGSGGGGVACFSDACGETPSASPDVLECWRHGGGAACFSRRIGLYLADGTGTHAGHASVIWRLFEAYEGETRVYVRGPRLSGNNSDDIRDYLASAICADLQDGTTDGFAVAGYSRGALIALNAAIDAQSRCDEARQPGAFVWAGLLDAVDTSITHMSKDVPSDTPFIHVRKSRNFEHVLTTVDLRGGDEDSTVVRIDTSHTGIACTDPIAADHAFDTFLDHARGRAGIRWGASSSGYDCDDSEPPLGPQCGPFADCTWPGW